MPSLNIAESSTVDDVAASLGELNFSADVIEALKGMKTIFYIRQCIKLTLRSVSTHKVDIMCECRPGKLLTRAAFMNHNDKGTIH